MALDGSLLEALEAQLAGIEDIERVQVQASCSSAAPSVAAAEVSSCSETNATCFNTMVFRRSYFERFRKFFAEQGRDDFFAENGYPDSSMVIGWLKYLLTHRERAHISVVTHRTGLGLEVVSRVLDAARTHLFDWMEFSEAFKQQPPAVQKHYWDHVGAEFRKERCKPVHQPLKARLQTKRRFHEIENNQVQDLLDGWGRDLFATAAVFDMLGAVLRSTGVRPGQCMRVKGDDVAGAFKILSCLTLRDMHFMAKKPEFATLDGGKGACIFTVTVRRTKGQMSAGTVEDPVAITANHDVPGRRGTTRTFLYCIVLGRFSACYAKLSAGDKATLLKGRAQAGWQGLRLKDIGWQSWDLLVKHICNENSSWEPSILSEAWLPRFCSGRRKVAGMRSLGGFNVRETLQYKSATRGFKLICNSLGYNPSRVGLYSWRKESANDVAKKTGNAEASHHLMQQGPGVYLSRYRSGRGDRDNGHCQMNRTAVVFQPLTSFAATRVPAMGKICGVKDVKVESKAFKRYNDLKMQELPCLKVKFKLLEKLKKVAQDPLKQKKYAQDFKKAKTKHNSTRDNLNRNMIAAYREEVWHAGQDVIMAGDAMDNATRASLLSFDSSIAAYKDETSWISHRLAAIDSKFTSK